MDIDEKVGFFFSELEKIVTDPISNSKTRIDALKTYATLLPSMSRDEITIKHEVSKMNIDALSEKEKLDLFSMLNKIEEKEA